MPAQRVTRHSPWHVVFLLDNSSSMHGKPAADVNLAVRGAIDEFKALSHGVKRYFIVSIIHFASRVQVVCEAESEWKIDLNAAASLTGEGGSTNASGALHAAHELLKRNPGEPTDYRPFVFFLSDGMPDDEAETLDAAKKLKGLSIPAGTPHVFSIGFGEAKDSLMRQVATKPEMYKRFRDSGELRLFFPNIGTFVFPARDEEQAVKAIVDGYIDI